MYQPDPREKKRKKKKKRANKHKKKYSSEESDILEDFNLRDSGKFENNLSSSEPSKSSESSSSSGSSASKRLRRKTKKKFKKKKSKKVKKINFNKIIEEEKLTKRLRIDNYAILLHLIDIEDAETKEYFQ